MASRTLLENPSITVSDFRCTATVGEAPFVEQHRCPSISYVRKGSFGCHSRGRFFELVAGSVLVGCRGDEFACSHDHVCGDECLSFFLSDELADVIGDRPDIWAIGWLPAFPELVGLGGWAQAPTDGRADLGLDEVGQMLGSRF